MSMDIEGMSRKRRHRAFPRPRSTRAEVVAGPSPTRPRGLRLSEAEELERGSVQPFSPAKAGARQLTCTSRCRSRPRRSRISRAWCSPPMEIGTKDSPCAGRGPELRMKGVPDLRRAGRQPDAASRCRDPQPRRPHAFMPGGQVGPRPLHDRQAAVEATTSPRSHSASRGRRGLGRKCGSPRWSWPTRRPLPCASKGVGGLTPTLSVPKHSEETLADNNAKSAPIAIREEKLKVLVVESLPRWEYRYLCCNALSRDPGVELSSPLFDPQPSACWAGGNKDDIKQFSCGPRRTPRSMTSYSSGRRRSRRRSDHDRAEPLAQGAGEATVASGLALPAGDARAAVLAARHRACRTSCPVTLDPGAAGGVGIEDAEPLRDDGAWPPQPVHSSWPTLEDENAEVWEGACPASSGMPPWSGRKPGPTCSPPTRTSRTRAAVCRSLVTRTFGAGQGALSMGNGRGLALRQGSSDKYHYRFWGQVAAGRSPATPWPRGKPCVYLPCPRPAGTKMNQDALRCTRIMPWTCTGEAASSGRGLGADRGPSGKPEVVSSTSTARNGASSPAVPAWQEAGKHQVAAFGVQADGAMLETRSSAAARRRGRATGPSRRAARRCLRNLPRCSTASHPGRSPWTRIPGCELADCPSPHPPSAPGRGSEPPGASPSG